MDKPIHKNLGHSNESSMSTTGTNSASPRGSDTIDNNLKYLNLNFVDNSESSSQPKDVLLDHHRFQSSSAVAKPPPSKILPTSLHFPGMTSEGQKRKKDNHLKEKSLVEMGFRANEVEGWENIVQPPKKNLYKLLKNMIDNHIKPNVQIRIGGVTFNCHMMVLQCYSDFFMDCNNEVLIQLPEEKITPGAFMMVYEWMLADEPLVQREGILELFNAANFLRINQLISQCWLCLDDDVSFREDTAFLLYLEARNYGLENLEQLMLMRICKFFLTLVASKEFLSLNAKEICTLLSSNMIGVNSEIEIFMSVVRWLSHDWKERESNLLDVVKCVRFGLMPPWFLVTLTKNTDCQEIDRIVVDPEVKKMISDGISYTTTQLCYGENHEGFLYTLERCQLVAPMQRQWVFDKECTYHYRIECPNMQYVSYKSFLDYLEMIRTIGKDYWRSLEMAKGVGKSMQCWTLSDGHKSVDQSRAIISHSKSRDRGIQSEGDKRNIKEKDGSGGSKPVSTHHKRSKISVLRTPRGHPKYVPSVMATHCIKNDNATEAEIETTVNFKYPHGNHLKDTLPASQSPAPQQQRYGQQPEHILYDNKNHHSTDMKRHMTECPSSPVLRSASDLMGHKQQHLQQLFSTKPQPMKQNHRRAAVTTSATCAVIYKRADIGAGVTSADVCGGDTLGGRNASISNNNDVLTRNNDGGVKKPLDDEDLVERKRRFTWPVGLKRRIPNQKIVIFGGIDPYCLHCQHEQQHQPFLQQPKQQKRMFPLGATTYAAHPTQAMNKTTTATNSTSASTTTHDNGNDNGSRSLLINAHVNNKFENFGDQVLVYDVDVDAMEWRHLSHIPFGSRHHHAVAVCNGLIYLIGGTRTALGCAKKSVFEKSVWCFDPNTLKWTLESSLPESRRDFAVVAIERRRCGRCHGTKDRRDEHESGFYVIGGEGVHGIALNTVWFYSVKRKLWIKKPSLNIGRYGLAAAMVNNEIWIAGGITNSNGGGVGGCGNTDEGGGSGGATCNDGTAKSSTAHVITDTMEIYTLKCSHEILAYNADDDDEEEGFENVYTAVNTDGGGGGGDAAPAAAHDSAANGDDGITGCCAGDAGAGGATATAAAGAAGKVCDCAVGQWIKSKLHLRVPRVFGKFCKMSDGDLYLVGGIGVDDKGDLTSLPDIDCFQVKQQRWQHYGDLNWPRHGHDVGSLNDHCFVVIGGVSSREKKTLRHVEAFCTKTRKCLKDLPDLPWPVSGCAVATLN